MDWNQLKQEAKKMGAKIYISPYDDFERIDYKNIMLTNKGDVVVEGRFYDMDVTVDLSEHRTNDQMLAIMKALQ